MGTAEDCWQELGPGIDLLNLLAIFPAPANSYVLEMLTELLAPGRIEAALDDLGRLEARLRRLPEAPGPAVVVESFEQLPSSELRLLFQYLAGVDGLYRGKRGEGATSGARPAPPSADTVRRGVAALHALKAPL